MQTFRSLLSLVFLAGVVWCSFKLPLGDLTFSEHMDRIGQTPEARELLDGSRSRIEPVMHEATDRVLGEYIEAPTQLSTHASTEESAAVDDEGSPPIRQSAGPPTPRASRGRASTGDATRLPGQP